MKLQKVLSVIPSLLNLLWIFFFFFSESRYQKWGGRRSLQLIREWGGKGTEESIIVLRKRPKRSNGEDQNTVIRAKTDQFNRKRGKEQKQSQ